VGGSGSEEAEEERRRGGREDRRRRGQDLPEERDETRLDLQLVIEWARQGSLTLTSMLVRAWSIARRIAGLTMLVSHSPSQTVQYHTVLYCGLNARCKRQDGACSVLSEPDLRRRLRLEA
jgi:hypothetical protein